MDINFKIKNKGNILIKIFESYLLPVVYNYVFRLSLASKNANIDLYFSRIIYGI